MSQGTKATERMRRKLKAPRRFRLSAFARSKLPSGRQRRPGAGMIVAKESGFVDVATAVYALNTTGSVTLLNTIAQGSTTSQRVGKKVMLKSVQIRGNVTSDSTTTVAPWAFMIVYDRRPQGGAVPAVTDILTAATATAMNNDSNSNRFSILHRQEGIAAGVGSTPVSGLEASNVSAFVKMNRLYVAKGGTAGTIDEIDTGALYLVTVGSIAAGTADANLTASFRTRFVDF